MSDSITSFKSNWSYPTQILFGPGRIKNLAAACRSLGMTKPLLVTDPGLAALPMVTDAIAANAADGLPTGLFSDVKPNPIGKNVDDGVAAFKAGGHDGVIAWGGGSGLDAAKAIAFMAGQTPADLGLRGCGRQLEARRQRQDRADCRGADHSRHRLRSRPRVGYSG